MTIKIILDTPTKKIIEYSTREEYKIDSKLKNKNGFRVLHHDFINNDESQGHHVTFVKGVDDPSNAPELVTQREQDKTKRRRIQTLDAKVDAGTATLADLTEIRKLERSL